MIELEKENSGLVLPKGCGEYNTLLVTLKYNLDFFVDADNGNYKSFDSIKVSY